MIDKPLCTICGSKVHRTRDSSTELCSTCWRFIFKQPNQQVISKKAEKARLEGVTRQRLDQIVNQKKYSCRAITLTAVRTGKLIRPKTCSRCNKECTPQAHHHDYSDPLNVEWLCAQCHGREHRKRIESFKCRICGRNCVDKVGNKKELLCSSHNYKLKMYGDPEYSRKPKTCQCGKPSRVRGRCAKCAYQYDTAYRETHRQAVRRYKKRTSSLQ